ncbi:cytochrome P450 [Cylindrobasidium torrendii FP15055 ss-10]|uniref:Cytochrome P450 n=1 Tax=Cylindrobasidium torrendii FP15055 ss-10 TaxID=1314674 RepID=A0A0D7BJF8_9AGAR|nr:cytochrome P450 [Cylindrobasidium torrendii FP15055 ss-10]
MLWWALLLCLLGALARHYLFLPRKLGPLPPGPRKIPLFGNLFQVPPKQSYIKFHEWAVEYGPIYHLRLGSEDIIVLNIAEAAEELLVKRSRIFSSRNPPHVAQEILSNGQRPVFMPYDKEWKTVRKSTASWLGPAFSKKLRKLQALESVVLVHDLLQHGHHSVDAQISQKRDKHGHILEDHWVGAIRRYASSVMMTIGFGTRIHILIGDPWMHAVYNLVDRFSVAAMPGTYLADVFPIFRKLPDILSPWRVEARKMHQEELTVNLGLLNDAKRKMADGTAAPSYANDYLKARADAGHDSAPGVGLTDDGWLKDTSLAYAAGQLLEAGGDTTGCVMQTWILFMLNYPHVYAKAREEIDIVVGSDRLPAYEDEANLPYVVAMIKELLRCRPPIALGIPHRADEDAFYDGYWIPKGSSVIGNLWAMHMNPTQFPNPSEFRPERWYTPGSPTSWDSGPDSNGRAHYAFGWGRRFCNGSHIAEGLLFIAIARIVWSVDLLAPLNSKTGHRTIPDCDDAVSYMEGLVPNPVPFDVAFKPRSPKHLNIVERAFAEAQMSWKDMGMATDER